MEKLDVNIEEKNTYYPIYISNENIEILRDKLLQEVEGKNYIVIFSQKVHKLYSKILNFPKDKIFNFKRWRNRKEFSELHKNFKFCTLQKINSKRCNYCYWRRSNRRFGGIFSIYIYARNKIYSSSNNTTCGNR